MSNKKLVKGNTYYVFTDVSPSGAVVTKKVIYDHSDVDQLSGEEYVVTSTGNRYRYQAIHDTPEDVLQSHIDRLQLSITRISKEISGLNSIVRKDKKRVRSIREELDRIQKYNKVIEEK